jgi:hypothetical protein
VAAIKYLGNGLYECTLVQTATASAANNVQIRIATASVPSNGAYSYTGDGASGLYVLGVSFTATASPLVELFSSPYLADTSWTKGNASVTTVNLTNSTPAAALAEKNTTAIDSINNGPFPVRLTESNANANHRIFRAASFTSGKTYRGWMIAKAGERSVLTIFTNSAGPAFAATFDLVNGIATGTGASMIYRGDGEWLCQVTRSSIATATGNLQIGLQSNAAYTGDGVSGLSILSAGLDENGVALYPSDATALLGASWTKDGATGTLATSRFWGISQRVDYLIQGGAQPGTSLNGQKWAALGDSQTANNIYTVDMASLTGMILTNLGVSGQKFSSGGDNTTAGIYNEVANIPSDTKVVTIHGGINDHLYNVPIGTLGDTTLSTFYGALYAISRAINARVPSAVMFFASPCAGAGSGVNATGRNAASANTAGLYVRDYQDAMDKFCKWQDIPFTDVGRTVGINEFNGDRVLADGLHYNSIGSQMIAQCWADDMNTKVRRGVLL